MSTEAPPPTRYLLRLQSRHGDDIHALRAILKLLLRRYGWRCDSIEPEPRPDSNSLAGAAR
jgi:hypothetical protein